MKNKTLYIIRHAKAEEHSYLKKDYNRNIIAKGIERSLRLAVELNKESEIHQEHVLFISSSANRAIQTAELICSQIDFPKNEIQQTRDIYEAHYKDILAVINQVPNNINTVIICGHNPGLSDLIYYLTDSYISLNTSAIAKIELEDWLNFSELSSSTANLTRVISE